MTGCVSDVLRNFDALQGEPVSVRATLVAPAEGVYLIDLENLGSDVFIARKWETADRLNLEQAGLVDKLLADIAPRVGGPFIYFDDAVVLGTVGRETSGSPALTDLRGITLIRDGERYDVELNPNPPTNLE